VLYSTYLARVRYLGDGVTDTFNIPFDFKDNTDVKVVIAFSDGTEVLLTFGVHYLVIGSLPSQVWLIGWGPLLAGQVMCVARDMPMVNTLDLLANDSLPSADVQNAMDRAFMSAAQAQRPLRERAAVEGHLAARGRAVRRFRQSHQQRGLAGARHRRRDEGLGVHPPRAILAGHRLGGDARRSGHGAVERQPAAGPRGVLDRPDQRSGARVEHHERPLGAHHDRIRLVAAGEQQHVDRHQHLQRHGGDGNAVSLQLSANGNINFIGITSRIKGVFYGTPNSQRTLFAPSAGPNHCYIGAVPSGAGNEAGFYMFGGPDPDNAPALFLSAGPTATSIQSLKSGTGVVQPLNLISGSLRRDDGAHQRARGLPERARQRRGGEPRHRQALPQFGGLPGAPQRCCADHPFNVFTKVLFTTEDFDQAGWFDTGTLARYTPLVPGKYMMNWALTYLNGLVDQKRVASVLYKNGVYFKTGAQISESGAEFLSTVGACLVDANGTTDYFELYAWHDMAANADLAGNSNDNYFAGFHIG
jgi:hypothetical protein